MDVDHVVQRLLDSDEPSIRYKVRVNVLGEDPQSRPIRRLQAQVRQSPLVRRLLAHQDAAGRITHPKGVYTKWQGAHWIAATLADIGYPAGDRSLQPLRDQLQEYWLQSTYYKEFDAGSKAAAYRHKGVPVMEGRHRRCASQQSNALWSIMKLGIVDARTHELFERLLHWQWPDGGWNCDRNPAACHSSFMESILPLRALALYDRTVADPRAGTAARKAAEIFLKRKMFLRRSDGTVIMQDFTQLHYPLYWHYDILHGLKVMAEAGLVDDRRCRPAIDLLVDKQLPGGGWAAEKKYYRTAAQIANGNDYIDWGGASKRKMNAWITADALFVLKACGRLDSV